jgi:lysozyme
MGVVSVRGFAVAAAVAVLGWTPLSAQEWQSLEDDVSRAQLFDNNVEPEAAPPDPAFESFALNGPFVFPANAREDLGAVRVNSIFGIDISHHQSPDPKCRQPYNPSREIDFSSLRQQEVRFVFVKATQGVGYRSCRFGDYWRALGALPEDRRVLRGAYHFLSSSSDAAQQAQSYIRLMNENGGFASSDLPPVLDLEWDMASVGAPDRWAIHQPQEIINRALIWLQAVEEASGRRPILYTARSWWRERGIPDAMFSQLAHYPLWVADYSQTRRAVESPAVPGAPPLPAWTLWQFADNGRLAQGYSRGLDINIFKGTEEEFRAQMLVGD